MPEKQTILSGTCPAVPFCGRILLMKTPVISDVYKLFPTKESCIRFIEHVRWKNKPVCPHCGSYRVSTMSRESRYHCNSCNTSFSVTVKTLFHNTRIPLQKWFLALEIFSASEKKLSARSLAEMVGVNKDTAWAMLNRMREAFTEYGELLGQLVEFGERMLGKKALERKP